MVSTRPTDNRSRRRTQEERRGEAEEALLDAAMQLFAERGMDSVSNADIGEAAGFSRGLVNHHFGSRAAMVERLAVRTQARFVDGLPLMDAGVESLMSTIDAYFERLQAKPIEARAFFVMRGSAVATDAQLRDVFDRSDARFRDGIAAQITAAQSAGLVRQGIDAQGFAATVVGMVRGVATQYLVAQNGIDLDQVRQALIEMVRASLSD